VPNEWIERVRHDARGVPGVVGTNEHDLMITYDPGRVLQQFREQFNPPAKVHAIVTNNTLVLAGSAPLEWIAKVRDSATKIPGISAINGDSLMVEFSTQSVIDAFRERFGMPDGVTATFRSGALILSGEAPHKWLDSVRRSSATIAGVRILDDRNVQDVDQREFRETEATIDAASILFVLNRDTLPPDPNGALASVAEDTKRCFAAAERMGVNVKLEVRGYGDATDPDNVNAGRSKRRADAVRAALIKAGIDEQRIDSLGMGTPPPPGPGEKRGAGQYDRRVFFRIVIQP
jgi:outer membrane protein OmpA-like peptidoglycan-associated protein